MEAPKALAVYPQNRESRLFLSCTIAMGAGTVISVIIVTAGVATAIPFLIKWIQELQESHVPVEDVAKAFAGGLKVKIESACCKEMTDGGLYPHRTNWKDFGLCQVDPEITKNVDEEASVQIALYRKGYTPNEQNFVKVPVVAGNFEDDTRYAILKLFYVAVPFHTCLTMPRADDQKVVDFNSFEICTAVKREYVLLGEPISLGLHLVQGSKLVARNHAPLTVLASRPGVVAMIWLNKRRYDEWLDTPGLKDLEIEEIPNSCTRVFRFAKYVVVAGAVGSLEDDGHQQTLRENLTFLMTDVALIARKTNSPVSFVTVGAETDRQFETAAFDYALIEFYGARTQTFQLAPPNRAGKFLALGFVHKQTQRIEWTELKEGSLPEVVMAMNKELGQWRRLQDDCFGKTLPYNCESVIMNWGRVYSVLSLRPRDFLVNRVIPGFIESPGPKQELHGEGKDRLSDIDPGQFKDLKGGHESVHTISSPSLASEGVPSADRVPYISGAGRWVVPKQFGGPYDVAFPARNISRVSMTNYARKETSMELTREKPILSDQMDERGTSEASGANPALLSAPKRSSAPLRARTPPPRSRLPNIALSDITTEDEAQEETKTELLEETTVSTLGSSSDSDWKIRRTKTVKLDPAEATSFREMKAERRGKRFSRAVEALGKLGEKLTRVTGARRREALVTKFRKVNAYAYEYAPENWEEIPTPRIEKYGDIEGQTDSSSIIETTNPNPGKQGALWHGTRREFKNISKSSLDESLLTVFTLPEILSALRENQPLKGRYRARTGELFTFNSPAELKETLKNLKFTFGTIFAEGKKESTNEIFIPYDKTRFDTKIIEQLDEYIFELSQPWKNDLDFKVKYSHRIDYWLLEVLYQGGFVTLWRGDHYRMGTLGACKWLTRFEVPIPTP